MKRREILIGGAAALGGAAAATLPAPAIAQGVKELKMVTSWPKNFPGLGTAAARFGRRIEAMSDGRYKVRVYGGGELVHPLKCHDAVQEGTAELYHSAEYYYQGKSVGYNFFASVPFGFTPPEMDAWLHHGGGQELWDRLSADFNVKPFPCGNSGSQMGGWFKKRITSASDFRGLKMRMPGLGGRVINELGGTAVTLGGAEIMPALEAGTIDATEWVGPWNDLAFGFYKIVKNYHYPGFHETGTVLSLGINKNFWDRLSRGDQEMFTACAIAENNVDLAEFNANNSKALDTLINEHGVNLVEFPDSVFREMGAAAKDVLAAAGATDATSRAIYDSFIKFRKDVIKWSKISDQSYMNKRELVDFHG
ncbi:MAG: TRAP transporter substrate-binding protein [Gammaproteobacteria bacterium]|nr:TRAP transporter substrate-binding protein [Gammaproteobacteria bacterium]MDD9816395.1 TRAP transporter substrate-binding protein [Gammaproteobacteria bacterium]MDD9850356.1 TRAP transporter substrate-binding protein [Gammaproteobacteria bacterium]MDD9870193.1 TRAP transporter substrate-binding protein [Gammaproteobacteria bacterium]